MTRTITVLATLFMVFELDVAPAAAQSIDPKSALYTLAPDSTYQHGCFEPCMCPLMQRAALAGTFKLRSRGFDGLFDNYDVTDVRWTATSSEGLRLGITGAGTYRIGGEFALLQQLSLDLAVEGQPVEHFDSGLVVGGSDFPAIVASISIHGEFCLDTVMRVRAKPVPKLCVERGTLSWDAVPEATGYDVVRGDLASLRASGGNFTIATDQCLANSVTGTTLPFATVPAPGTVLWFALRSDLPDPAQRSYDSGFPSQARSRDPGINATPVACP